jgi:hypothetical protein
MNADKPKPLQLGGTLRYARGQAPAAEETKILTTKARMKDTQERQRKSSQQGKTFTDRYTAAPAVTETT